MSDDLDMASRLLTSKEVSRLLGVTELTLGRWRKSGTGPAWEYRGKRTVGYRQEAIDAWTKRAPEAAAG